MANPPSAAKYTTGPTAVEGPTVEGPVLVRVVGAKAGPDPPPPQAAQDKADTASANVKSREENLLTPPLRLARLHG